MKKRLINLELALSQCLETATADSLRNASAIDDHLQAELESAMNWFAFTMPAALQKDGLTSKETIPFLRKVEVVKESTGEPPAQRHPLIKEIRPGKIILAHPIIYKIKKGDNLSKICHSLTGGKASVSDLRKWNAYLTSDTIHPGKGLWLADPDDELVKAVAAKFGDQSTRHNPEINLNQLDPELANKYAGLMGQQYQVHIQLQYNEPADSFLNPAILAGLGGSSNYTGPWAPDPTPMPDFGPSSFREQLLPKEAENWDKTTPHQNPYGSFLLKTGMALNSFGFGIGGMEIGSNFIQNWAACKEAFYFQKGMNYKSLTLNPIPHLKSFVRLGQSGAFSALKGLTSEISLVLKVAGRYIFISGAVISLFQGFNAYQKGNYLGTGKAGLDIAMGAVGLSGFGFLISLTYFVVDGTIGWENAFESRMRIQKQHEKFGIDPFDSYRPKW